VIQKALKDWIPRSSRGMTAGIKLENIFLG
jgi:hypothetical protein